MNDDHNCSQICVELEGSFNCSCYSGYELQQDRATCKGNYINGIIFLIIVLFFNQILMSVYKDCLDVIRTVLILLEAIIVLVWMDMNWN